MGFYDEFPKLRSECQGAERPCPWIRCKHHIIWYNNKYSTIRKDGTGAACKHTIYLKGEEKMRGVPVYKNNPYSDDYFVDGICSMEETCTLDVLDTGNQTLESIAGLFNLTRERVSQLIDNEGNRQGGVIGRKLRNSKRAKILKEFEGEPLRLVAGEDV